MATQRPITRYRARKMLSQLADFVRADVENPSTPDGPDAATSYHRVIWEEHRKERVILRLLKKRFPERRRSVMKNALDAFVSAAEKACKHPRKTKYRKNIQAAERVLLRGLR